MRGMRWSARMGDVPEPGYRHNRRVTNPPLKRERKGSRARAAAAMFLAASTMTACPQRTPEPQPRLVRVVRLGSAPFSLAPWGDGVAVVAEGTLLTISRAGEVRRVRAFRKAAPLGLAVHGNTAWLTVRPKYKDVSRPASSSTIMAIDLVSGATRFSKSVTGNALHEAIAFGALWVLVTGPDSHILRLDLRSQRETEIPVLRGPSFIAATDHFMWVVHQSLDAPRALTAVQSESNHTDAIALPRGVIDADHVAGDGRYVWVATRYGLYRMDERSHQAEKLVTTSGVFHVTAWRGYAWATNEDGRLLWVNRDGGREHSFSLPEWGSVIAGNGSTLWVALPRIEAVAQLSV